MKTTKTKENIQKKLNRIQEEIGETIIVRMGMKKKNKFDLLNIKCLGDSEDEEGKDVPINEKEDVLAPSYVG
jgi:hypothetical protein